MNSSLPHLVVALVALSVAAGGMMCVGNYWKNFADAVQPNGGPTLEKPLPLAEAAPEIVKNREAFRTLANQARFAIGQCQKQPAHFKNPIGHGKVVVWDLGDGDLSEALVRVPAELRATSADGPLTFLLIGKQEDVPLDMYYHKQQPGTFPQFYFGETDVRAYRVDTEVCVVAMPGARPRGKFTIEGDYPPGSIEMLRPGQKKVVGHWTPSIGRFAELCVKGVPPQPPPEIVSKGKEALIPLIAEAKRVIGACERTSQGAWINRLPQKAVVWQYQPEYELDKYHNVNWQIPQDMQSDGKTQELVVFFHIDTQVREPRDRHFATDRNRYDLVVAAVMLPGPRPLGTFVIPDEPESIPKEYRPKYGPPSSDYGYAYWIRRFLESQGEWVGK